MRCPDPAPSTGGPLGAGPPLPSPTAAGCPPVSSAGSSAGDAHIVWGFCSSLRHCSGGKPSGQPRCHQAVPPSPSPWGTAAMRNAGWVLCWAQGRAPTQPGRLCLLCPALSVEELMHSRGLGVCRGLKCPHCFPCFLHSMAHAVTPRLGCGCVGWACEGQEQRPGLRHPLCSRLGLVPVITRGMPLLCFPDGCDTAPDKGQSPPRGLVPVAQFLQSAVCLCQPRQHSVISQAQGWLCCGAQPHVGAGTEGKCPWTLHQSSQDYPAGTLSTPNAHIPGHPAASPCSTA